MDIDTSVNQQPFDHPPTATNNSIPTPSVWRFSFLGDSMEYFKIWIVNWLLTIITLGFYSPWAKVRRLRYFYGQTQLNNRRFDFVANPKRILIGRIIALSIYIIISIAGQWSPELSLIGGLVILAFIPWIMNSTLKFRARNSKYSNTRFSFSGSTAQMFGFVIASLFLGLISFGLLLPLLWWSFKRHQFSHTYFGQYQLSFDAKLGQVYKACLMPFAILIGSALLMGALFVISSQIDHTQWLMFLIPLLYFAIYLSILPLFQGYLFKVTWQNVSLDNNHFNTDINPLRFAFISATNILALIPSLGLLWAWGQIRMTRYQINSLSLIVHDAPKNLQDHADQDVSPVGEEFSDLFDIDISW